MIDTPLGRNTPYPEQYSPQLLCPVARNTGRAANAINADSFFGVDLWTAYELSWLDDRGKPQVRVAAIGIPCHSPNLVESKSLKLYLNSLNNSRFASEGELVECIRTDLSACVEADVQISVEELDAIAQKTQPLQGTCLDNLDVTADCYSPEPGYLKTSAAEPVTEVLYSHLLKTNCPVTGQPDWATLWLKYLGRPIERSGLLKYLISFRNHRDFHELCVERIFTDIMQRCETESLQVYARYTRRGGLDINPFRSSEKGATPPEVRIARQ